MSVGGLWMQVMLKKAYFGDYEVTKNVSYFNVNILEVY